MPFHVRNRGKRADGTTKWQCRWTHPNNSKQHVERQFRDKDVARRWGKQMDKDAHDNMYAQPVADERTFAEVVDIWKQTCWSGLQPHTCSRYDETLRLNLLPAFGHTPVREITRERVRVYFAELIAERKRGKGGKLTDKPRYAPGTVRKIHTVFSAAMREALDMGLVPSNPCARVRGLPPVSPKGQIAFDARRVAARGRCRGRHLRQAPWAQVCRPSWLQAARVADRLLRPTRGRALGAAAWRR